MTGAELVGGLAAFGVLVALWWPIRLMIAQRTERAFEEANPRNAEGIIVGAEPIQLRGSRPGAVLLLHGYNDSPQSVGSLAGALHDHGWSVYAPVLPGHARTLQAFARASAADWITAAHAEYGALRKHHDRVAVVGMSMGGALALLLAAEHSEIRAVVGIAPYLNTSWFLRALVLASPIAALGARYIASGGRRSVHDASAADRMIAYRASTPRLVRQLESVTRTVSAALPRVRQPVLVVQSREDNRIPARYAIRAFTRIGSPDKTLDWVTGAGHVLTVDYGHEQRAARIVEWLSVHL